MPTQVALVAVAGMVTFIAMLWISYKANLLKNRGVGDDDKARLERIIAETTAEVARLRERVQVLEKLATDDDRKLADEINRLREDDARS